MSDRLVQSAAGSFGLLGVHVAVTLRVEQMTYALMRPYQPHTELAIPPPPGWRVPAPLRANVSDEERRRAFERFRKHAEEDAYSEWFFFPYMERCWVNCWSHVPDPTGAKSYPGWLKGTKEVYLAHGFEFARRLGLRGKWFAKLAGVLALADLMDVPEVRERTDGFSVG